jgi:hypothetical protein
MSNIFPAFACLALAGLSAYILIRRGRKGIAVVWEVLLFAIFLVGGILYWLLG